MYNEIINIDLVRDRRAESHKTAEHMRLVKQATSGRANTKVRVKSAPPWKQALNVLLRRMKPVGA